MKKKILGIFVCMLLIATALPIIGTAENIEIKYSLSFLLDTYDYVIITTSSLESALASFKDWKEAIGYSVKIVNVSWISSHYTGWDLVETIRNFLIDKYSEWSIDYVLIVGSISFVPMRYCFPNPNDLSTVTPTDYYYADLSSNWDSDGDGNYGEYGHDYPDFNAEVLVGRIPIDNPNIVEDICQKIIEYEQDDGLWKKKALSLGAILYYANENHEDIKRLDSAVLMEELRDEVYNPNGFSQTTMYEFSGLDPSNYSCDYALNHANVMTCWPEGYGIVDIDAHHYWTEDCSKRRVWAWDDGDGVPEDPELSEPIFLCSTDNISLDNNKPSIVFNGGCTSARPENLNNLGKSLLVHGAIAYIGATRVPRVRSFWDDESRGGGFSIEYYFMKNIINNGQTFGEALCNCKSYYRENLFFLGWGDYQNLYTFNLYGDPTVSLTVINPPSNLHCEGNLNWTGVKPGSTVTGNFTVRNVGYNDSLLDWEIIDQPGWGKWTFNPQSGVDLAIEDGDVIVEVTCKVPNVKNDELNGRVRIENLENPDDYCVLDVAIITPKNKPFIFNFPLLNWLFERFPNAFPILRYIVEH